MVRVLYRNDLKKYCELAGGSSYRGENYSKCMEEIKGKPIFVRVCARFELGGFELSGVDCIHN